MLACLDACPCPAQLLTSCSSFFSRQASGLFTQCTSILTHLLTLSSILLTHCLALCSSLLSSCFLSSSVLFSCSSLFLSCSLSFSSSSSTSTCWGSTRCTKLNLLVRLYKLCTRCFLLHCSTFLHRLLHALLWSLLHRLTLHLLLHRLLLHWLLHIGVLLSPHLLLLPSTVLSLFVLLIFSCRLHRFSAITVTVYINVVWLRPTLLVLEALHGFPHTTSSL